MTVALLLPPELDDFVRRSVESGRFHDEDELLLEAIETLKTKEDFRHFQLDKLKERIAAGVADLEAGRVAEWSGEDIKRKGRELLKAR